MTIDGVDLGPSMTPQDVLIWLRIGCGLDDADVLPALRAGADRLEQTGDLLAMAELSDADRAAAVRQARDATNSRLVAWRRRNRQMTWLELRALFVGLRETGVLS
jgi:hypothetical protein